MTTSVFKQITPALSDASRAEIDRWLKKFPPNQKQSAVLRALTVVQAENGGYLTEALMDAVAAYLNMPKIAVYEVVSFYSLLTLKPVGKHQIAVCNNVPCLLRGSEGVVCHLKKRLGVELGEVTADGRFSIKEVECLAACGGAPMMQIGKHYYENLNPERIDQILAELE